MVYGIENPSFYDVYELNHFERIRGQKNIGLFSFEEYMAKQNIFYSSYSSDSKLIERDNGIKSRLFLWMKGKNNPFVLKILYGIQAEDFMNRLGMPILAFLSMVEKFLKKYKYADLIVFLMGLLFLMFFSMPLSLLRWLCFKWVKMWHLSWKHTFVLGFFLFYLIEPHHMSDFVFVFPTLLSLNYHLQPNSKIRSRFILFCCMIVYFKKIDLFLFFMFPIIRNLYALSMLMIVPSLLFPQLTNIWSVFQFVPTMEWYYTPNFIFFIVLFFYVMFLFWNQKKRSIQMMLLSGILCFVGPYMNPCFSVYMIDIGQGDCTLLVEPFLKSAIMIDVGQNLYHDNVELFVAPFLNQLHINKLDALIVTHDDFDHSGGVESLQKAIPIKKVIRSHTEPVPVNYPMYSLLPNRDISDENSKSIVSYFVYDDVHYLWTGDAGIGIEEQLLKTYKLNEVDILKLGHHGSKTSSSFEFLDALRPTLALVSAGYNNRYGHPDSNVMANCHQLGIHTLATKDVGMIAIHSWHQFAFFRTANQLFGWLQVH